MFQYLIELKNKLKIEHYICASNSTIEKFEKICKILIVKC